VNIEKKPIIRKIYLKDRKPSIAGLFLRVPLIKQRTDPMKNHRKPCPKSPNITPKSSGKVTIAKTAGFISLCMGIP